MSDEVLVERSGAVQKVVQRAELVGLPGRQYRPVGHNAPRWRSNVLSSSAIIVSSNPRSEESGCQSNGAAG